MISSRTLRRMAKKWQKIATKSRKRITAEKSISTRDEDPCTTSPKVKKGHFVVYTDDKKRFTIPLMYLQNENFSELLDAAEEQFGLPRNSPITLACNALFMEYALSLIQRHAFEDLKKAFTMSMANGNWFSSSKPSQEHRNQCQTLVYSF